jgi:hypothetical protein
MPLFDFYIMVDWSGAARRRGRRFGYHLDCAPYPPLFRFFQQASFGLLGWRRMEGAGGRFSCIRTVVDYRKRAEECRELAKKLSGGKPEDWTHFLEMAQTWEALAICTNWAGSSNHQACY